MFLQLISISWICDLVSLPWCAGWVLITQPHAADVGVQHG